MSCAEEEAPLLTILYTAEAHGALLPCDCPLQPLGGVARRATLIKRYRARGPVALIDGGGWGAGGMYDEDSDGDTKRDELRTALMAEAMKLMKYDATGVGPQESGLVANASRAPSKLALPRTADFKVEGFALPIQFTGWSEPGTPLLVEVAPPPPKTWDRIKSKDKKSLEIHISRLGEEGSETLAGVVEPDLILNAGRKASQRIFWSSDRTTIANFDFQSQRMIVIEVFKGEGTERLNAFRFRVKQEALTKDIPDDAEVAALLAPHLEALKKKGKKRIDAEFWTMPECPGCIQARPDLSRVVADTAGRVAVTMHFVIHRDAEGKWGSLHGEREYQEARVQAVVQKYYPAKIWEWLEWREANRDAPWTDGAQKFGMLAARLRGALAAGEGDAILAADYELMQRRKVDGTPTLILGNKVYDAPLERLQMLRVLCGLLDEPKPSACKDVPACFFDAQCRKRGFIGKCVDAGKTTAHCDTSRTAVKVPATVVIDRDDLFDNHERILEAMLSDLPGLDFRIVDVSEPEAQDLLKRSGVSRIPAYFVDPIAKTEVDFDEGVGKVAYTDKETGKVVLRPLAVAAHRLVGRGRIKGRIDLFVARFSKNGQEALESALDHVSTLGPRAPDLKLHDVIYWKDAADKQRELAAPGGLAELEEAARAKAVRRIAPEQFNAYLVERGKRRGSSWWDVPLKTLKIDIDKVRALTEGPTPEILAELEAEADLIKALDAGGDIVVLAENVEIIPVRSRQDLRELIDKVSQKK